jgi:hypothetical protein
VMSVSDMELKMVASSVFCTFSDDLFFRPEHVDKLFICVDKRHCVRPEAFTRATF